MRLRNLVISFKQRHLAGRDLDGERFAQCIFAVEQLRKWQAGPDQELRCLHDAIGTRNGLRALIGKCIAAVHKRLGQIYRRTFAFALKRQSRSATPRKQAEQQHNNRMAHHKWGFNASAPRADGRLTAVRASRLDRAHASYFWRKE
ncbi:hypothetical protein XH79_02590 [Bradyrhizobium sp. CCBAU 45389]|nr:hypothetical protein [Bradyrhizobium sp. CCBAU 45389]